MTTNVEEWCANTHPSQQDTLPPLKETPVSSGHDAESWFWSGDRNIEFQSSSLGTAHTELTTLPVEAQEFPKSEICSERSKISYYIFDSFYLFWYISNKMQRYRVYLFLWTALHVSGGISTHHQKHIKLYLQHLALVKPLLLPAAIVGVGTEVPTLPPQRRTGGGVSNPPPPEIPFPNWAENV